MIKPVTDVPEPGRPTSLDSDFADATSILSIVQATSALSGHVGASARSRIVREAIWFGWEHPRLPRPLVASKYPTSYPWSAAARNRFHQVVQRPTGGWGLVFEHLRPRGMLVRQALAQADRIDAAEMLNLLREEVSAAVITREEDKQIDRAAVGGAYPPGDDGSDLWARYRYAGLELSGFAPLQ
ncbi:MAG: hypothetical protein PHU75_05670 [Candidatus Nanopelagicales bacterium]|nr:hypothetical protein [Candidatus Nanopelagicales bacterium]